MGEYHLSKHSRAPRHSFLLKREREQRGWSQLRVAKEVGTDRVTVSRWERGVAFPYPHFREKLCLLFGKDAQALGLLHDEQDTQDTLNTPATSLSFAARPSPSAFHQAAAAASSLQATFDPMIPLPSASALKLVGRDALLYRLIQRLCVGGNLALCALHGLPGVGKTALAIAMAYHPEIQEYFRDGIFWASLGPRPNVLRTLKRWGSLLGLSPTRMEGSESLEAWAIALRNTIGDRRMLFILDDAWRIEDGLALLVGGPHCAHLVTTRVPQLGLCIAGDGTTPVPELNEEHGLALLARFVPELLTLDLAAAQELVRYVGGLPLALRLVGKYLQVQSYSGQPRRLSSALARLRDATYRLQLSDPQPLSERHPSLPPESYISLLAVLAITDRQLDQQARSALHALAVFPAKPNSFSEEAALAVSALPAEILDQLSDIGFLESSGPGRYTLHPTIRDYAQTQLGPMPPSVYHRLVTYMAGFVEAHITNIGALEQESHNIFAALDTAREQGMSAELFRIIDVLSPSISTTAWQAPIEHYRPRPQPSGHLSFRKQ